MKFTVYRVNRAYGPNGWTVQRTALETFQGLHGLEKAAAYAANLALVGNVVEIWGTQETLRGPEERLVAILSWWSFKRGATSVSYDTDYLD